MLHAAQRQLFLSYRLLQQNSNTSCLRSGSRICPQAFFNSHHEDDCTAALSQAAPACAGAQPYTPERLISSHWVSSSLLCGQYAQGTASPWTGQNRTAPGQIARYSDRTSGIDHPAADSSVSSSDWGPGTQQLTKSLERLLLEAFKLMQEGQPEHAEQLVLDGITTAEELQDPEPLGLVQLKDQLALLQYVRGDLKRARQSARDSFQLAETKFSQDAPIAAMCQLRLGTVLQAMGDQQEGLKLLKGALGILQHSMGENYPAAGEARFYIALTHASNPLLEAERREIYKELEQGLAGMQKHEGAGAVLVAAALREHHRLIEAALADRDWARAKALYQQEVTLHDEVLPGSEALANITYQASSFLYVIDHLLEARAICQRSIDLCEQLYAAGDDHRHLRTHRMGTICVADSNFERAELLLVDSEKHFQKHLGPRDPLTGEARLCLAVARIKLLDAGFGLTDPFTKVLAPLKRRDYLTEATAGLAAMQNGYSEGHMLVEKAVQLHKLVADLR